MSGVKRHIVVDTLGLLLVVVVSAASADDGTFAPEVLGKLTAEHRTRLELVWADGMYERVAEWVARWRPAQPIRLEVVTRSDDAAGFEVLPRRWMVERTFAWLGRCRRLSKDYKGMTSSSEAFVKLATIHLMARRLVKKLK